MLLKKINLIQQQTIITLLLLSVLGCSKSETPPVHIDNYSFIHLDNQQSKIRQSNDTLFEYYNLDSIHHEYCYKIIDVQMIEKYTFLKLEYLESIPKNSFCPGNYSIKALKIIDNNQLLLYNYLFDCLTKHQLDSIVIDASTLKGKSYLTYFSDTYLKELSKLKKITSIDDIREIINSIERNDFNSGRIMYSAEQLNLACIKKGYNPFGAALIIDSIMMKK